MPIKVLFFGATAAIAGEKIIELEIHPGTKARDVIQMVLEQLPALNRLKLKFSVNQRYCNDDVPVGDGDELAIFTAVSGG